MKSVIFDKAQTNPLATLDASIHEWLNFSQKCLVDIDKGEVDETLTDEEFHGFIDKICVRLRRDGVDLRASVIFPLFQYVHAQQWPDEIDHALYWFTNALEDLIIRGRPGPENHHDLKEADARYAFFRDVYCERWDVDKDVRDLMLGIMNDARVVAKTASKRAA